MAKAIQVINTNPHRPVDFNAKAISKVMKSHYVAVQTKEDGCQLNLVVQPMTLPDGTFSVLTEWLSREGKEFPAFKYNQLNPVTLGDDLNGRWKKFFNPHLGQGLYRDLGGFLLQCEIIALNEDGTDKVCAETSGSLARHEALDLSKVRIVAFDLIPLAAVLAEGDYEVMQSVRYVRTKHQVECLNKLFPELNLTLVEEDIATDLEELEAIYDMKRHHLKKEGVVAKDPMGFWKRGKKTGQWKVVPDDSCDGEVVGIMWGTPGLANEGKVIGFRVLTEHGVEVDAGGITEELKEKYTAEVVYALRKETRDTSWSLAMKAEKEGINPFKGMPCTITYKERLPSGSYRHPNWSHFRGLSDPMIKE